MLFFAWFTLASCLMLTHNEKDILLQNMHYLQNIKNISSISFMSDAYSIATDRINANNSVPQLSSKHKKTESSYHDLFVSKSTGYAGFKFSGEPCVFSFIVWLSFAVIYIFSFTFFLGNRFNDNQSVRPEVIAIFASIIIFVFEMLFKGLSDSYLYFYICRMQINSAYESCARIWAWAKFILNSVSIGIIRILLLLIAFLSWVDPKNQVSFSEDVYAVFTSEKSLCYWVFIAIFYVVKYAIIRPLVIRRFNRKLKNQSEKYLCADLPYVTRNWKKIKSKEYLMIAYMYCTMLKINEYYSQYKDENGVFNSMDGDASECKSEVKKA